ncbi:MerR family transcriptional regulator [Spirochaeta cellobiosiphila]|uniref:MerR family transcriptional regulator n=1 Tax=Spirochaeta cellobiosiphila TaxID=504483 RepID=UPI0004284B8B|nr:MerR family transcriptional regulator [Spirochaeta cellobiosiphila]
MTIKILSEKTKLPIPTIRYYDKLGLFPELSRDYSDYGSFSTNDFKWVIFIDRLKDTGMKIKDIVH